MMQNSSGFVTKGCNSSCAALGGASDRKVTCSLEWSMSGSFRNGFRLMMADISSDRFRNTGTDTPKSLAIFCSIVLESLGAEYRGRKVGNLAQIGCYSFNGNKIITTGSGGMIVTNDPSRAAKAKYLTTQAKDDPVEYVHKETGFNYRLSNVQAALGCAQMELLDEFVAIKRNIAAAYAKAFADVPGVTLMQEASWARSIFWE